MSKADGERWWNIYEMVWCFCVERDWVMDQERTWIGDVAAVLTHKKELLDITTRLNPLLERHLDNIFEVDK